MQPDRHQHEWKVVARRAPAQPDLSLLVLGLLLVAGVAVVSGM